MAKDILKQLDEIKRNDIHAKKWMQKDLANLKAHMKANPSSGAPSKPPASGLSSIAVAGVVLVAVFIGFAVFTGGDVDTTETATPTIDTSVSPTQTHDNNNSASPTPTDDPSITKTPTPAPTDDNGVGGTNPDKQHTSPPTPDGTVAPADDLNLSPSPDKV